MILSVSGKRFPWERSHQWVKESPSVEGLASSVQFRMTAW